LSHDGEEILLENFTRKFKLLVVSALCIAQWSYVSAQVECNQQDIVVTDEGCGACYAFEAADDAQLVSVTWTQYGPNGQVCAQGSGMQFCARKCFVGNYMVQAIGTYVGNVTCTTQVMVTGCGVAGECDPSSPPDELPAISFVYLEQCGLNGKFSVRVKETCLPYVYEVTYYKFTPCLDSINIDTLQVILQYPDSPCVGIDMRYACIKATLPPGCCHAGYVGYRTVNYKTRDGICNQCTACSDACQGAFVEIVDTECNPDGNLIDGGGSQYERWVPGREYTVELSAPSRIEEVEVYDMQGRLLYRGSGELDRRRVEAHLRRRGIGAQVLWIRMRYSDGREGVKRWLFVE